MAGFDVDAGACVEVGFGETVAGDFPDDEEVPEEADADDLPEAGAFDGEVVLLPFPEAAAGFSDGPEEVIREVSVADAEGASKGAILF